MTNTRILPPERPIVKAGSVSATVNAGSRVDVKVAFDDPDPEVPDEPFPKAPYVTATITSGSGLASDSVKLNVEAYSITKTGCTIGLYNATSRQINMKADWIAVLP